MLVLGSAVFRSVRLFSDKSAIINAIRNSRTQDLGTINWLLLSLDLKTDSKPPEFNELNGYPKIMVWKMFISFQTLPSWVYLFLKFQGGGFFQAYHIKPSRNDAICGSFLSKDDQPRLVGKQPLFFVKW